MSKKPVYYDKRSDFWKHHFDIALDYDNYLKESNPKEVKRWIEAQERMPVLTEDQLKRLKRWNREMNVLMYSGVWCGDCVRQGPLLKQISEACGDDVNLRVIERDASEQLQDELRIVGALRVPMVVFLSEDWWEIGRFGERTLSYYRAKAAREIGANYNAGMLVPKARTKELSEWVDIFERMLIMLRLSPPLRRKHGD